ncbi:MAG: hypothetical protein Kow0077_31530 [Anaerolineae bacterium]
MARKGSEVRLVEQIKCPYCMHLNTVQTLQCVYCGRTLGTTRIAPATETVPTVTDEQRQALPEVPTRQVDSEPETSELRWGNAQIDETVQVVIHLVGPAQALPVDIHSARKILLGRMPPDEETNRLDLTPFGGLEEGVSREHACLELANYSLYITDLNSTNGTYLNGLRILPKQARVVRDGDEIRLGRLKLMIKFVRENGVAAP